MRLIINVDVPDLHAAIRFYTTALDLKLERVLDDDVAELSGASSMLYLLAKPAGSGAAQGHALVRDYARHWTPVHMDFVVDDLDAASARAIAAGAVQESGCIAWRGSHCITFSDPFGHGFCLIAFERDSYQDDAR